jgi:hypothetical protein
MDNMEGECIGKKFIKRKDKIPCEKGRGPKRVAREMMPSKFLSIYPTV